MALGTQAEQHFAGGDANVALMRRRSSRGSRSWPNQLRRAGNEAVHEGAESPSEALHQLEVARELAVWFRRTFGNSRKFDPGSFIPASEPQKVDAALHAALTKLREHVAPAG